MASLQERVNNRKYYKRVRRDGKWVTIDTRTNKVVDRATRLKHKSENKKKWIQRGKNREEDVKKWLSKNIGDRLVSSDQWSEKKGRLLTKREDNKEYEKEIANRKGDDSEMTAKQQANALKISKKRNLVNMKPLPEKSEDKDDKNESTPSKEDKPASKLKSRKTTGRDAAIRRNIEIHGREAVERQQKMHQEWKIARKNGTLDAWEKKWHPDRKRKYGKLKFRGKYRD